MASQTFRRLLPKTHTATVANQPGEPAKKRKLVPIACARCRSHKTKCGGQRPSCGTCRSRNVECKYDDDPNTTPAANLRRQYHILAEQHKSFQELFDMLRNRPEDEALGILKRLRSCNSVQSTLQRVKEAQLLANMRTAKPEADDRLFGPAQDSRGVDSECRSFKYPSVLENPSRKSNTRSALRDKAHLTSTLIKMTGHEPRD
ncbi:hypothetical protein PG985_005607 [Apiospora marii]|uniref:uncharacterized protein n=1 Tax=Apiospora marii TaxID=335849 RepID=UPI00313102EE